MEKANIDRINELAKIAKTRDLTPEELSERDHLRSEYLQAFRSSFKQQLENTVVEYPDGSRKPLKDVHNP